MEYAVLLGLVQIVITFGVVWFLRSSKTTGIDPDKRLLLSVDYTNGNNGGGAVSSYENVDTSSDRRWERSGKRMPVLDTSNFMDARPMAYKTSSEGKKRIYRSN